MIICQTLGVVWSARNRRKRQAEQEAQGVSLWTETLDRQTLGRIAWIWLELSNALRQTDVLGEDRGLTQAIAGIVMSETGMPAICLEPLDLPTLNLERPSDVDRVLDLIDAIYIALTGVTNRNFAADYQERLNRVLSDHRIAYKMIDGQLRPFRGDPVYSSTIEPTIRLLIGRKFEAAERAYMKALDEIRRADGGDAITDAGTALEETLKALGCEGNALGPRMAAAKRKGLLGPSDAPLQDAITKAFNWAAAERSSGGDAHNHPANTTVDDAWLMVQIVGALILRLAAETPRATIPG